MKENDYINKLFFKANFKNEKTIEQAKKMVTIANAYITSKIEQ